MILKQKSSLLIVGVLTLFHQEVSSNERIVGGIREEKIVPFQISLQGQANANSGVLNKLLQLMKLNNPPEWTHFCSGCIITESYVLTAAHCLDGADHTKISVLAGTLHRSQGGQRHMIHSYTNHPNYTKLHSNDISIIKVEEPFTFGPTINKIEFRSTEKIGGGVKVFLSGWGYSTPLAWFPLPISLRSIILRTITNEQCQKSGYNITSTEICTSGGMLRGACMGDSGGPLVTMERTLLVGLVSYGSSMCGFTRPEAYTRVSELVPWIKKQIQE